MREETLDEPLPFQSKRTQLLWNQVERSFKAASLTDSGTPWTQLPQTFCFLPSIASVWAASLASRGTARNRLPQSIVNNTYCLQKSMPVHKPLLQPQTHQRCQQTDKFLLLQFRLYHFWQEQLL
ncbi:hypothetical protein ES332_D07G121900v1 [Gossypium tomentosum]|uniref:Uncharacterized protein n=1 Tax=Gossypium tomentosum TaxID=34277 RepID=A0A5D2K6D4_GOSTO|nr:hypothetical protein ES332_D07G121900v1 [Gossypium tomentosum]